MYMADKYRPRKGQKPPDKLESIEQGTSTSIYGINLR